MCPVNWVCSLPLQLIHILTKDGLPGPPYVWHLVFLFFVLLPHLLGSWIVLPHAYPIALM